MKTGQPQNLEIIGSTEYVDIAGIKNIPAKIDTGADSSSIWASHVCMQKDGTLNFALFGKKSPFYTGELIKTKDYKVKAVRSSNGHEQIRYQVRLPLNLNTRQIKAAFTLANRKQNNFPVLIGRKTISGKFMVDVSKSAINRESSSKSSCLNRELGKNPYEFHQKYIEKGES